MAYPNVPPPFPPARRSWLMPAAIAALVLAVVFAATTGWFLYTRVIKKDSGIAVCEELRQDALDGDDNAGDSGEFTEANYLELREAFEDSRHDDLRVAGVRFSDVFWQLMRTDSSSVRASYRDRFLTSLAELQGACANHDIVITIDWTD